MASLKNRDLTPEERAARLENRDLTPVWGALAEPTRREILDLLKDGPRTLGQLAEQFPVSRFAIRKHLNILEAAHLVVVRWQGRERWNFLNVIPIQTIYERWVTPYHQIWADRLFNLKQEIEGHIMTGSAVPLMVEQVELEIAIAAPPSAVWRALVDRTEAWWPRDFYTGPAKGFHIEARIGGRVFEDWGDGAGVIWYHVFGMKPEVSLDLQGAMGVPFGPAMTLLHLELAVHDSGTLLKVSDSTLGRGGGRNEKLEGWRQVFSDGLKTFVEQPAGH
jgi:DNA-binding transcriptional ArsR family regulator